MKFKTLFWSFFLLFVFIVGLNFIRVSLRHAAAAQEPGKTPVLAEAPLRLFGRVEPLGREIFISSLQPKRVVKILASEGQMISAGQVLIELEADVEQQAVQVALSRVNELESQLDIILDELKRVEPVSGSDSRYLLRVPVLRVKELESRLGLVLDDLKRKEPLLLAKAVSEQDYTQKKLEAAVIRKQISTAMAEAEIDYSQKKLQAEKIRNAIVTAKGELELKRRELGQLKLASPIDALLYKLDVRQGELLTPQDYQRVVLGDPRRQVRIFVETFWLGKVRPADSFIVKDGETLELIGEGTISEISQFVGARDFRSEDSLERLDTKYAQAILHFAGNSTDLPLGKLVLCERKLTSQQAR